MTDYGPKLAIAQELHAQKYRGPGETFYEAMCRIAATLADGDDHRKAFKEILLNQRFLPAGRVQAAMGSPKVVTAFNCYVMDTIPDSMQGIMRIATEAAETMRMGGGVGYDFSTLRPKDSRIMSLDSKSSGPVSFMDIFNSICGTICSAGHRRGAQMGVMRVDHPDIQEFVRAKQNTSRLTNFNISVAVTDAFMEALEGGEKRFPLVFNGQVYDYINPQALWEEIMRANWDWAEPGVLFIDTINKMNPLYYCETIVATNPCFTGDTKVWTVEGHKTFCELAAIGKDVQVLSQRVDGRLVYRWMRKPRLTQRNTILVRVTLDDGTSIRCTPNHKFFLKSGEEIEAVSLKSDMSLQSVYRWKANQKGYLRLSNGMVNMMEHHVSYEDVGGLGSTMQVHHIDANKVNNAPCNLKLMTGVEHRREHMMGDNNPSRRFPERNHFKWADWSGEKNGRYRHDINDSELQTLRKTGLSYAAIAEKVGCSKYTVMKRLGWNHKVISVEFLEEKEDVYCGTVDETHNFFISLGSNDGVLVRNCGEQPLPPNGACLLGSFNLVKYITDDRKFNWANFIADIPIVVRAMDNVIEKSIYPLKAQELEAKRKRRMGLGITGLANALEAMGHPYGSSTFIEVQNSIMSTLAYHTYCASIELAKEKGAFKAFDREFYPTNNFLGHICGKHSTHPHLWAQIIEDVYTYGIRNSHLLSVAPTGTISLTADNISSGIEPVFCESFDRTIHMESGIVKETITDYGVRVFGTKPRSTAQVTVDGHLQVLLTASKWVDSAVSKTCNIGDNVTWKEFTDLYLDAWRGGAKGCTTFRAAGKRAGILEVTPKSTENEGAACYVDPSTGQRTCE